MKATDNAFPYQLDEGNGNSTVYTGLEARDYIAIQAMVGLLAGTSVSVPDRHATPSKVAALAYSYADAMLKQSEVKE